MDTWQDGDSKVRCYIWFKSELNERACDILWEVREHITCSDRDLTYKSIKIKCKGRDQFRSRILGHFYPFSNSCFQLVAFWKEVESSSLHSYLFGQRSFPFKCSLSKEVDLSSLHCIIDANLYINNEFFMTCAL